VGVTSKSPASTSNICVNLAPVAPSLPLIWGLLRGAIDARSRAGGGSTKRGWGMTPTTPNSRGTVGGHLVKCSRRRRGFSSLLVYFGLQLASRHPFLTAQDHRFPAKPAVSLHFSSRNGDLARGRPPKTSSSHPLSALPSERCTVAITPTGAQLPSPMLLLFKDSRVEAANRPAISRLSGPRSGGCNRGNGDPFQWVWSSG